MSRPLAKHQVVTDGDMSAPITSEVTITSLLSMLSYDISWDGTAPDGAVTVEVSNTYSLGADGKTVLNPGTWTTLTLSAPTNITGDTGNGFIDIDATAAYAVRLVYTPNSGTGRLNVTVNGKVM